METSVIETLALKPGNNTPPSRLLKLMKATLRRRLKHRNARKAGPVPQRRLPVAFSPTVAFAPGYRHWGINE